MNIIVQILKNEILYMFLLWIKWKFLLNIYFLRENVNNRVDDFFALFFENVFYGLYRILLKISIEMTVSILQVLKNAYSSCLFERKKIKF